MQESLELLLVGTSTMIEEKFDLKMRGCEQAVETVDVEWNKPAPSIGVVKRVVDWKR